MKPRLSIIIPFYNRRQFLRTAVLSALADRSLPTEVIVIDDASTDEGAKEIEDLPIKIVHHETNAGPARARNTGLSHAQGDLIYFFDSDDEIVPNSLPWLIKKLDLNPDWQAVGGRTKEVIDELGNSLNTPWCDKYCNAIRPEILTQEYLLAGGEFSGGLCLFVFRKSFLQQMGPLDENLRNGEDRDYLLRSLTKTSLPLFDQPLLRRRVHSGNLAVQLNGYREVSFKPKAKAMNRLLELSYGVKLPLQ